jgi:hypothetical protein
MLRLNVVNAAQTVPYGIDVVLANASDFSPIAFSSFVLSPRTGNFFQPVRPSRTNR